MMDISPESFLVGCAALDSRCYRIAANAGIRSDQFRIDQARAFWKALEVLNITGGSKDLLSVIEQMRKSGTEPNKDYIGQCMEIVPTTELCEDYARNLLKDVKLKRVRDLAERMKEEADSGGEVTKILGDARMELDRIQTEEDGNLISSASAFVDLRNNIFERMSGKISFAPTGYKNLDAILGGGMLNSGLYLMAARPGMGKSTIAVNMAEHIAKSGSVLYISLEMSHRQLSAKRLAAQCGIPSNKILMGTSFSDEECGRIAAAMEELRDSGIVVNRRPGMTVADIATMAQSIENLRCIMVDHIGLVVADDPKLPQYEKTTRASNALKQLAISLDVPIMALCQLSRECEKRQNKRPELSDLRDSGALEQDADAVFMLYSEEYYGDAEVKKRLEKQENPAHVELAVKKNRHAGTGVTNMLAYLVVSKVVEE